jgi:hypothetical protein
MPLKLLDRVTGTLFTPYFGKDITFNITITSGYIATTQTDAENSLMGVKEDFLNVSKESSVGYEVRFHYEGMMSQHMGFMETMWKNHFGKTDNVLLGENLLRDLILMPYDCETDPEFFKHYYFVRNSFCTMNKRLYLKVEPEIFVTAGSENLLQTLTRNFGVSLGQENLQCDEIRKGFVGKIVKAKYSSWNQFYRITDVCCKNF